MLLMFLTLQLLIEQLQAMLILGDGCLLKKTSHCCGKPFSLYNGN